LAFNPAATEARGIRLRGERDISRKTTAQGMPECSDCTCMLVCALLAHFCTRDRGCSKHPAFPAPSFLWAKRFAKPGRNAPRECGGVCVEPSLRANGSRECAPDDRLREAIHSAASREMDCFVASLLAMTGSSPQKEDGFSMPVDRGRRNASSDIRPIIIGDAPGRHSEECRQHQSRHEQNHRGKLAHALASQPALHSISENEHGPPSRKMQPG
jgi:hypothetical protein